MASYEHRQFLGYSVAAAVGFGASLALLPLYAGLPADQFGVIATGQAGLSAVTTIARLGLPIGMFRHVAPELYGRTERPTPSAMVTTTAFVSLLSSVALAVGAAFVAVSGFAGSWGGIVALVGLIQLIALPRELAEYLLRAGGRAWTFLVVEAGFQCVAVGLSYIFLWGSGLPAEGFFLAFALGNAVVLPTALLVLHPYVRDLKLSGVELVRSLRFGFPSVPALLADWTSHYSDRLFVAIMSGMGQAGTYAMGYRLGQLVQQVYGTAAETWWSPYTLGNYARPGASRIFGRAATYVVLGSAALTVSVFAATPLVLDLVRARPEYREVDPLVLIVGLANVFLLAQMLFLTPTSLRLRPEKALLVRLSAAGINLALNFILIPAFGMYGAAWSTLLTFAVAAGVAYVIGKSLWRVDFEWSRLAKIAAAAAVCVVVSQLTTPHLLRPVIGLASFAGALVLLGFLHPDEWRSLVERARLFQRRGALS